MLAAGMMYNEGKFDPPQSWLETGEVHTPEDDKRLTDFEKNVSAHEASKFEKDARGRLKVPKDWDAPSGFRGRVIKDGTEMNYPGVMRKRTYVK